MPFTFTMPKLSPTMEEGTLIKWFKKEGEYVQAGETLLEIATDKATVEHSALDEGWLRKILVREGAMAILNQPLAIFTTEQNESIEGYVPKEPTRTAPSVQPTPEKSESKSASTPISAPLAQPLFVPEPPLPLEKAPPSTESTIASPLARDLAKQKGLDLSTVKGSGPGGRIVSQDLEKAQPERLVTFGREQTPTLPPGSYEEIPLTPLRKVIALRLQQSKSFIPHFYLTQTLNAEALVALRDQLKNHDLNITFNDMIIRACALALRKHPSVNTGFNSQNQTIIQFKTIDISVAVTVDGGLITPIIRHADYKNLGEISVEMRALAERARTLKLKEHEYKGGSFSLSNLGMFGISGFTAVINPPQAAILAIGGIVEAPVVKNGAVVAGKTLTLTLSSDHRVIDGTLAAQFMKSVQHLLENPSALLLS